MSKLSKWQLLNLRGGGTGSTAQRTAFVVLSFTAVSEATVPYPADWTAVLPEITVYRDGIVLNQNAYTPHVEADHVRIVFRVAGDYTVKLRA